MLNIGLQLRNLRSRVRCSANWANQAPLRWYLVSIRYIFYLKKKFYIYLFLRDRERVWVGEGQREKETQNLKQDPGSEVSAQSPTRGSNSQAVRSWPEPKSDAQLTEPPRCPRIYIFAYVFFHTLCLSFIYAFVCINFQCILNITNFMIIILSP